MNELMVICKGMRDKLGYGQWRSPEEAEKMLENFIALYHKPLTDAITCTEHEQANKVIGDAPTADLTKRELFALVLTHAYIASNAAISDSDRELLADRGSAAATALIETLNRTEADNG